VPALSPEQCGRRILKVCTDHHIRPGEHLLPELLALSLLAAEALESEAAIAGLNWLIEHGYLEARGPLRSGYVLIQKGALLSTQE
jgi:hypothetical protein